MVIMEVYNIGKGLETITRHVGRWKGRELNLDYSELFERRKDFHGYEFEAVVLNDPPLTTVITENEEIRIGGLMGKLWHDEYEKHMNFSTRIRLVPDGKWGGRNENGTWNGMIKELHEGRSDVALCLFAISKARSEVVDFSSPLIETDIGLFIKYPERESSWMTFIRPFKQELWFSLAGLLMVFAMILSLTYHLGPEKIMNPQSFTFSFNIFLSLVAQMGQGSSLEPKSLSSKLVFLTIFVFSIFLITCFSAKLTSLLAFVKLEADIESLEDVLQSDYKIGTLKGTLALDMFRYAQKGTVFEQVFNRKNSEQPRISH